MKVFNFEEMITPKIISFLYLIVVAVSFVVVLICLYAGNLWGAVGAGFLLLFSRVFFESLIVIFKNNEYLRRITMALEGGKKLPDDLGDNNIQTGGKNIKPDADFPESPQDKQ